MSKIQKIPRVQLVLLVAFFGALVLSGVLLYRDYGVGWDTTQEINLGKYTYTYLFKGDPSLLKFKDRYYGPAWELVLFALTRRLSDTDMVLARNLWNFLLFAGGVFLFYLLGKRITRSWKFGLLGCALICLSPRIFADAFYNTKDIPAMVLFIAAFSSMFLFLDRPGIFTALLHAFASAFLITVRLPGVLIPVLTLIFVGLDTNAFPLKIAPGKRFWLGAFYLVLVCGLTVLFWPATWHDPIPEITAAFQQMSRYPWLSTTLYWGQFVHSTKIPWHYIPSWLLITTPFIITLGFLVGLGVIVVTFLHYRSQRPTYLRDLLIICSWLIIPLVMVVAFHSILYDGWRHLFFIYPAYVLIAILGFQAAFHQRLPHVPAKAVQWLVGACLVVGLLDPLQFMVRNHPYENVYFSIHLLMPMDEIRSKFEMDYWGLSYRQGLEFLVKYQPQGKIYYFPNIGPADLNTVLLSTADRKRFVYTNTLAEADYFITNFRWHPQDFPYRALYSVNVDGTNILTVYALK